MTKAIAITQQGDKTLFLIGDYQATLSAPSGRRGWRAEYFKGSRELLNSNSENHPVMPSKLEDQARAQYIVKMVIGSLHANQNIPKMTVPTPRPKRPSKRKVPKKVTPIQVVEDLLSAMDDNWTIMIPSGKPAALRNSKVQICDQHGEVACEIPYRVYQHITTN